MTWHQATLDLRHTSSPSAKSPAPFSLASTQSRTPPALILHRTRRPLQQTQPRRLRPRRPHCPQKVICHRLQFSTSLRLQRTDKDPNMYITMQRDAVARPPAAVPSLNTQCSILHASNGRICECALSWELQEVPLLTPDIAIFLCTMPSGPVGTISIAFTRKGLTAN